MFHLGGDDKEKLKENMEEIKQLVNEQQEASDQAENQGGEPEMNRSGVESPNQQEPDTERPAGLEDNQPGLDQNVGSQSFEEASDEEFSPESESMQFEDSGEDLDIESGIPSSESESEPLFLNVDEFEHVKGMVDEMKYLSQELDDLTDDLERGVQEDARIEEEARDVVNEVSRRRQSVDQKLK